MFRLRESLEQRPRRSLFPSGDLEVLLSPGQEDQETPGFQIQRLHPAGALHLEKPAFALLQGGNATGPLHTAGERVILVLRSFSHV